MGYRDTGERRSNRAAARLDRCAQLGRERPLYGGDRAEGVPKMATGERIELLGRKAVVGLTPVLDLRDLMLEPQGGEQLEGLLEHAPL